MSPGSVSAGAIGDWFPSDWDDRAILGQLMAFCCNPEAIRLDLVRIALNLQSIHNPQDCKMWFTRLRQDCEEREEPGYRIAGLPEDCTGPPDKGLGPGSSQGSNLAPRIAIKMQSGYPVQSKCNPSELPQDCMQSGICGGFLHDCDGIASNLQSQHNPLD